MPQINSMKSYKGGKSKMPIFTSDPVQAHPVYTGHLYAETINTDDLPQTPDKKRLSVKGIVTKVNK